MNNITEFGWTSHPLAIPGISAQCWRRKTTSTVGCVWRCKTTQEGTLTNHFEAVEAFATCRNKRLLESLKEQDSWHVNPCLLYTGCVQLQQIPSAAFAAPRTCNVMQVPRICNGESLHLNWNLAKKCWIDWLAKLSLYVTHAFKVHACVVNYANGRERWADGNALKGGILKREIGWLCKSSWCSAAWLVIKL
jgi:hypothetical protein